MRTLLVLAVTITASSIAWTTPARPGNDVTNDPRLPRITEHNVPVDHVPGQVLLKLHGVDATTLRAADAGDARALRVVDATMATLRARTGVDVFYVRALPLGWALVGVPHGIDEHTTAALATTIAKESRGLVQRHALNRWVRALRTPNDEFYAANFMWHIDAIAATDAWDVTIGSSAQRIAVIDSGTFLAHEDLSGKDANGFDFISDDFVANDGDGRDANYNDPGDGGADCFGIGQAEPDSFHGSHVAGTILANADNGLGIVGVNWEAELVTARALGRCGGNNVDIMEALAWLAGEPISGVPNLPSADRPSVVNMSLGGGGGCDQFSADVVSFASAQGALPVIAAGNDAGPVNSPANCPGAIAVAAFGPSGGLASYSSFGDEIDIVGPGGDQDSGVFEDGVLSFYSNAADPPYTFYQGTSMAAPHVSGVIGLMQAIDPSLTRSEILDIFDTSGAASCRDCAGKAVLRADLAVQSVTGIDTDPGDACVGGACSPGQACVSGTCRVACDVDADCAADEICASGGCVDDGGGEGGEGEGELPPGACDERRGNMDCPNGEGCVDGVCEDGEDDGDGIGALCGDDDDCATGLCDRGVCTVTCDDEDCRDGYECDEDAVPGGLCRAESCADEDEDFCENGWACSFSDDDRYVCAVGESNYQACAHMSVARGNGTAGAGLVVLGVTALLFRRRRM